MRGLVLRVATVHIDDKTIASVLTVVLQDALHVEVLVELPVGVAVAHQEELGAAGLGELCARKVDQRAAEALALPLGTMMIRLSWPWAYSLPVAAKRSAVAFSRLSPKSEPSSLASAVFAISVAWANISS